MMRVQQRGAGGEGKSHQLLSLSPPLSICVLQGTPISVMFLAPGVTPWKTTLPGVVNGANNPGIRVFEYDRVTLDLQVRRLSPLEPQGGVPGVLMHHCHP